MAAKKPEGKKQSKIINKISTKTIFGTVNAAVVAKHGKDGRLHTMRVMGMANALRSGETDKGEFTALLGRFRAIHPTTGEVFESGQCFLPNVALNLIRGAVSQGNTVEFAYDIIAELDESANMGFAYRIENLVQEEKDPFERLMTSAPALLSLAAPK